MLSGGVLMFTNADVTLYLYHKCGKDMRYIRIPVEDVYWEDVRQSTFLKTGQRDAASVLLVIPLESLCNPLTFTQGKDRLQQSGNHVKVTGSVESKPWICNSYNCG